MTVKPYNCSLYEVMVHRMLILMQFLYTHVTRFFHQIMFTAKSIIYMPLTLKVLV